MFTWLGSVWRDRLIRIENRLRTLEQLLNSIRSDLRDLDAEFGPILDCCKEEHARTRTTILELQRWLKRRFGPGDPRFLDLEITGEQYPSSVKEKPMADKILFNVVLPPWPEGSDIQYGELTVEVDGVEAVTEKVEPGTTEVPGFSGPQGSTVKLTFAYVDDAGNRSVNPATFAATLEDIVPPADPGALGIVITGEEQDNP